MAHTARGDDEEKREHFDRPDVVEEKVATLARWISSAKHLIAFTGAGISTAAGIPDFRSGMGTVLKTGPGVWELKAKKKSRSSSRHSTVATTKAIPTPSHMMMVKLWQENILKALISQNTDGLHRRSGIAKSHLFELHGNSNLEKCSKCRREYLRDFRTRSTGVKVHDHKTGRLCDDPKCRGTLRDSIVNFGENLPDDVLEASCEHAEKSDLCLAMGSSLTVTPAADIPQTVGKKKIKEGGLVIVNLQVTPLDRYASLRINAKCEDVAKLLTKKLGLTLPEFTLKRKLEIGHRLEASAGAVTFVNGLSADNRPFSYVKEVQFELPGPTKNVVCVTKEPFQVRVRRPVATTPVAKKSSSSSSSSSSSVKVKVVFFGHYGEPPLDFSHVLHGKESKKIVELEYNPFCQKWNDDTAASTVAKEDDDDLASGMSKLAVT